MRKTIDTIATLEEFMSMAYVSQQNYHAFYLRKKIFVLLLPKAEYFAENQKPQLYCYVDIHN